MIRKLLFCFLITVVFISCQTGKPLGRITDDTFMYAMIYDNDNTPVNAVTVFINGIRKGESDIQGRFILDNMTKGEYTIRLVKRGYETFEERFHFDPLLVLYFKIINTQQLVTLAEAAMDTGDYNTAQGFINRALAIEPNRPDILFLSGVNHYLQGQRTQAIRILENLVRSGSTEPAVTRLLEIIRQQDAQGE